MKINREKLSANLSRRSLDEVGSLWRRLIRENLPALLNFCHQQNRPQAGFNQGGDLTRAFRCQ